MKILLCLLSDQHIPNLLSVHHYRPDRLVLIESAEMRQKNAAVHFQQALQLGNLNYRAHCDVESLDAEDSLDAVHAVLQRVHGKNPSAHWIANITGGTKPMSIATYQFFQKSIGSVVYTNIKRPSILLSLHTNSKEECQHKLSIKEFLAGYGFESRKSDANLRAAEDRARIWTKCARLIAAHTSAEDLLPLSDDDRKTARSKGWNIASGRLKSAHEDVGRAIQETFELQGDGGTASLHGMVNKYAAEFLTGGWLEVFFWDILHRHGAELGVWDVRLGLEVGREGDSTGQEFDVAFMHNYGLEMIECKSGSQEHDKQVEILYKVEAITKQFRALRVKSYLATTGRNVLDKEGDLKNTVQTRASIYNCEILRSEDIQLLAKNADSPELIKKHFFGARDST